MLRCVYRTHDDRFLVCATTMLPVSVFLSRCIIQRLANVVVIRDVAYLLWASVRVRLILLLAIVQIGLILLLAIVQVRLALLFASL